MKARVLTVVVTFNAGPYIRQCLDSLLSSGVKTDALIIDNGSTDGTVELIKSEFPDMELIQSPDNLGFGKANNIGLQRALTQGYEYAFLLNQDAWIQLDTLSTLIDFHTTNRSYGILSPLHLNKEGTAIDPKFSANLHVRNSQFLDDLLLGEVKPCYDVRFVNAALWLLPLNTLQQVGGFNEFYFMYGEDGDFCERVWFHEMKVGIVPTACGHHARYNAYYAEKGTIKNLIFTAKNWRRWSYEKVTSLSNTVRQGFFKSIENVIISVTTNLMKRRISTALGICLGWWIFLFTLGKSLSDRKRLMRPGPLFLSE